MKLSTKSDLLVRVPVVFVRRFGISDNGTVNVYVVYTWLVGAVPIKFTTACRLLRKTVKLQCALVHVVIGIIYLNRKVSLITFYRYIL